MTDPTAPLSRGWAQHPDDPAGVSRWYSGAGWTQRTTGQPSSPTANWTPAAVEHSTVAELAGARESFHRGDRFFQFEIEVGETSGDSRWGSSAGSVSSRSQVDLLGGIEQIGWKLEDVGYVYAETGSVSTDRLLRTGQGTVNKGVIVAIYLFRRGSAS